MTDSRNANPATDDVADRTEGAAASSAFGVDAKALVDTWGMVLNQATTQPKAVFEAGRKFAGDLAGIWFGSSDVNPGEVDRRFSDEAWGDNPLFRRIGQSYLAWSNSLDDWLSASGLTGIDHDRAQFVLSAAKDVLAPVNTLVGNPAALKKIQETQGASLISGMRNVLDDVRHNHGYPAVADRNAFTVGVDVAASAGGVVFRNDLFELIQYQPKTAEVSAIPLLYVFSQVNRFYLGDLTPDRSLFQQLLDAGIPVFAISWRNPEKEHSQWGLDAYADGVIEAIRIMRDITAQEKVHLMGLCAGGLVTAAAAGVMQARGDDWVDTMSLFVNVLDFRPGDSEFGLFVTERSVEAQKSTVRSKGLFSERDVFEMFAMLRIEENVMSFFRANYLLGEDPPKHPLLYWSMDYTRVPAEMQCTFLDLSQYNQLAKRELRVLGKRLDLSQIDYPIYLMAGSTDHITPWRACYRSARLFGGNVEFVLTNQNHTQTISSRIDNRHLKYYVASELPADADAALRSAAEHAGSWTGHWTKWLGARSDEALPAPVTLGSERFPVLGAAPGEYVLA